MDLIGALSGVVAGAAFAPGWGNSQQIARAQYIVTGAEKGPGAPFEVVSRGLAGAVGNAALREQGLKLGVEQGLGSIPEMVQISADKIKTAGSDLLLIALLFGAAILLKE